MSMIIPESLAKALRPAIQAQLQESVKIVMEDMILEAEKKLRAELAEKAASVAIRLMDHIRMETLGHEFIIRIDLNGGKKGG